MPQALLELKLPPMPVLNFVRGPQGLPGPLGLSGLSILYTYIYIYRKLIRNYKEIRKILNFL